MIFTANYIPMQLPYDVCEMDNFLSCANLQNHYEIYLSYVRQFNGLRNENPQYAGISPEEILLAPLALPWQIRTEFVDVAGGLYNHELVFDSMTPSKATSPSKALADEITASFGDMATVKKRFIDASNSLVGTGYVMIIKNPSGSLNVISMSDEESSIIDRMYPILMLDLWEHAYASNFFERENYVNKWFKYINWDTANARYASQNV